MNALLKKHFWVVNLLGVTLLAWMTSGAVNDVIASRLAVPPKSGAPSTASSGSMAALTAGRVPVREDARDTLVARRVFDLDPPEDSLGGDEDVAKKVEEVLPDDEGDKPEEPTKDEDLPQSDLPIELIGTVSAADEFYSIATIKLEGEMKLATVGQEFLEGKAKILKIAPRHIVVKENDGPKLVKLWEDPQKAAEEAGPGGRDPRGRGAAARSDATARPVSPARPVTPAKPKGNDYSKGVKKTGPYDYELDKSMLDEQLEDLSSLGTQARVVPNYRNGKYEGFKLVGVRPGSLYRAIGIRSGDVIKSINGKPIDSPNKAIELFDKLRNSSALNVEIERRGQPKQLNYTIK